METKKPKNEKKSGVLLHITSLPGNDLIGTLGKKCFKFIDFLEKSGQTIWQINPLGPTGYGDSPYQSFSAFAGNIWIIDIEEFVETGYLEKNDWENYVLNSNKTKVDFGRLTSTKLQLLFKIYKNVFSNDRHSILDGFEKFCEEYKWWLNDFAIFMSLKSFFGGKCWNQWPEDIKLRYQHALVHYGTKLKDDVLFHKFLQYIFFRQWMKIKKYANSKNINIIGDVPIFVAYDSSDVWSQRHYFMLDRDGNPSFVAGVPPDYFSETGQLWGNPLYNWESFKHTEFDWWLKRIGYSLYIFDGVRIDHFRGFEAYWTIPASEKTAINGYWSKAPCYQLFNKIYSVLKSPFIIAEDLGIITEEVEKFRDTYKLPGMKVLQFAFETPDNDYLPHNYLNGNCVVYTGTHDNETTLGWYKNLNEKAKNTVKQYIPGISTKTCCWRMIEYAIASSAKYAIIPMQDLFELDNSARMNAPSVASGNWQWRYEDKQLTPDIMQKLLNLCILYNRTTPKKTD
ncbi:4-alpha-glucanotransferase [Candidatus Dependentiae bacterium]|nr:4-alpha-glucanotransferase [Candidatus Dependentiae bacterium]